MIKPINGWTRESIIKHINETFKGRSITSDPGAEGYPNQFCAYRGDNETKCAVGMFIPDDLYSDTMEGYTLEALLRNFPKVSEGLPLPMEDMQVLQKIHDERDPAETTEQILTAMINYIKKTVVNR